MPALRVLAVCAVSAFYVATGLECSVCKGKDDCDLDSSETCKGDFCFYAFEFDRTAVRGCGHGAAHEDFCLSRRFGDPKHPGRPEPVYCQCRASACHSDANVTTTDVTKVCHCKGDHCGTSPGLCFGWHCWEARFADDEVQRGCTDQFGLINGRFCMSPPFLGLEEFSALELDQADVCFCNDEDYCNMEIDLDKTLTQPHHGWMHTTLQLNHFKISATSEVRLIRGVPAFTTANYTSVDGFGLAIEYAGFTEDVVDGYQIAVPETTTVEAAEQEETAATPGAPDGAGAEGDETTGEPPLAAPKKADATDASEDSSNTAVIAVFVVLIALIAIGGIAWKCELHKRIFAARYQTVAG